MSNGNISEPIREWTYRGFNCRLYRLGDITLVGYVQIGDRWKRVIETDDFKDYDGQRVENEVDKIIDTALDYDESNRRRPQWPDPNPNPLPDINPDPGPDPYPDTDPDFPWNDGPVWFQYEWYGNDLSITSSDTKQSIIDDVDDTIVGEEDTI